MQKSRLKAVLLSLAAVGVALVLYLVVFSFYVAGQLGKLHMGMTEADVISALGQPTQAYDWDGGEITGKTLSYHYCYLWDHPIRIATESLNPLWRYYNPAYIEVQFRNGSPTATTILYHRPYARRIRVVAGDY